MADNTRSDITGATVFGEYLEQIKNPGIRTLTSLVLDQVGETDKYFFKAPASSSGKYHPECSRAKPGGLIRHTFRAIEFGKHLSRALNFSETERDIVVASLILHDICKKNYQKHASSAAGEITYIIEKNPRLLNMAAPAQYAEIIKAVGYHMGPWTEKDTRKPMTEYNLIQLVVYFSDYLSSRPEFGTPQDACSLDLVKSFLIT